MQAMWVCAGLLAAGGVVSWFTIPDQLPAVPAQARPPGRAAPQLDCPHRGR
jgi:hypothetical protein